MIFQLAVEVFKVFAQARVPQRPLPVVRFLRLMKDVKGVFALFPGPKKCEGYPPVESERCPPSVSSSELSAHQMALAGESDEREDEPGRRP